MATSEENRKARTKLLMDTVSVVHGGLTAWVGLVLYGGPEDGEDFARATNELRRGFEMLLQLGIRMRQR